MCAFMGDCQLPPARFAPAKAGACADLRGCAASVGSQAFGDRMVRSMRVCYPRLLAYTICSRVLPDLRGHKKSPFRKERAFKK